MARSGDGISVPGLVRRGCEVVTPKVVNNLSNSDDNNNIPLLMGLSATVPRVLSVVSCNPHSGELHEQVLLVHSPLPDPPPGTPRGAVTSLMPTDSFHLKPHVSQPSA